jgi:transposase
LCKGKKSISDVLGDHRLSEVIVEASAPLNEQIRLLITIPGITPLTASAFLADIGDGHPFPSLRRQEAARPRIAMIRRLCGVMLRMLLEGEQFHWLEEERYRRKLEREWCCAR